jgi:putative ABC transport system permease protein
MKTKAFSLSDIALGNLRNRKRQYVLLSLGIALAIYFVATALLFGFGIYTSLEERQLNRYGEQNVMLFDCGGVPLDDLLTDGTLSAMDKAEVLGEAVTGDYETRLFSIAQYDDTSRGLSRRRLKEGAYPAQAGEIALERTVLAQLRQDAEVGDTVTLTLRIPDGNGGFLSDTVEKTYTLTGILYDQLIYWDFFMFSSVYHDIPAGLVSDKEPIEPGGRMVTMAYGVLSQDGASMTKLDEFCEAQGISYTRTNGMLDMGNVEQEMIFTGGFAVLVGIILVIACCLGIVNAFSANLDARRRQIGLLRAVGATQKQIKNIFGRETLILSLIAIPIGLVLGVLSVFVIFSWLGEDYVLILSPWVLLGVAALGVMCVMLASRIPLRRASAVSPMQAIRDVDLMRRVRKRKVRSRTEFVAPRLIASRSGQIYRRKRAGICAALVAGILVFTLASLFVVTMTTQIGSYTYEYDYRIYYGQYTIWDTINYEFHKPGLTEQDKQDVMALPLVETVLGEKQVQIKLLPEELTSYATGDGWQYRFTYLSPDDPARHMAFGEGEYNAYLETKNRYYDGSDYLSVSAIAVDESIIAQMEPFVCEGCINLDKLRSGDEVLLVAPKEYALYFAGDESGSTLSERPQEGLTLVTSQTNDMFRAGDTLNLSLLYTDAQENDEVTPNDVVRIDKTVTIGALLDNTEWDYSRLKMQNYPGFLDVITTLPGLSAVGFDVPYTFLSVRLSETPDAQTEEYLNDSLERITARVPDASLSSSLEYARENRRMVAQSMILSAALSILMFAIVASMMNNALSAHIRAGRRSIGTLRAVGMGSRDIFRSYFYQMIPMFAWGGGIGLVLSLLAGQFFIQHLIQSNALRSTVPQLPVWQPLVFAALLLAVCAWNVRARLRGILRESITENIREL